VIELPPLDARIPAWNLDDLVERACPVCGRAGGEACFRRPDRLLVRRCAECTTWYVSPAPSSAQLDAFYARYDEQHRRDPEQTPEELLRAYRRTSADADFRLRELASLRPLAGARVLDVGFGRARMLYDLLRMGAEPHGVELDDRALAFARALGITHVTKGTLDDLPADARYDAILLCDLIEHPLRPLDVLAAAARRLVPGGLLLVWTPNGSAADREREPITFRVDLEHMQYFTPVSLARVAAGLGLAVVHLETSGNPDLDGIDRPRGSGRVRIKDRLRAMPWFETLGRVRRAVLAGRGRNERDGVYGLFALLEKPRA
jgi:2-polyprenyl-3-methyl-5-hydroxy-6-metoxy-1,4-benzoquinol methylase